MSSETAFIKTFFCLFVIFCLFKVNELFFTMWISSLPRLLKIFAKNKLLYKVNCHYNSLLVIAVNYFHQKLHLRCLIESKIRRCAIWYHLYDLKNVKTPMEEHLMFFQIAQIISNCATNHISRIETLYFMEIFENLFELES